MKKNQEKNKLNSIERSFAILNRCNLPLGEIHGKGKTGRTHFSQSYSSLQSK